MEPLLHFQTQHSTNSEFENSEVEDSFHLDSDENKSQDDEITPDDLSSPVAGVRRYIIPSSSDSESGSDDNTDAVDEGKVEDGRGELDDDVALAAGGEVQGVVDVGHDVNDACNVRRRARRGAAPARSSSTRSRTTSRRPPWTPPHA